MANLAWIVERRETASQVLVDSMQKVGNANSSSNTRLRIHQLNQNKDHVLGYSIAVQTSPIHSPKDTTSSPNPSLNSSSTTQEYDTIVPPLDIEALQKRSEGCQSMGLACRFVCINCGNSVSERLTTSSRDEISVLSAKTSDLSISMLTKANENSKKPDIDERQHSSDYILQNLGLNSYKEKGKGDTLHQSKNGGTSVISICLADPEEFSKEEEMEDTSEDSLERMVMPPLNLVVNQSKVKSDPHKESEAPLKETQAEGNNVKSQDLSECCASCKSPNSSGNSNMCNTWSHYKDPIRHPVIPIEDHRPRKISNSSQSDSKDSKDRRRSFGFNLKHTPEDMSAAMPRMYMKKGKRKNSKSALGRFLEFFGVKKKKKRGPGHFNKIFDG